MTKKKYGSYDNIELYQLINETWEVTDRPYLLFTSYALSCLSEALESDDGDDDNDIWGKRIPERILKSVVKNAVENFNDAAMSGTRIDVWGRPYSIRQPNGYDKNRLVDIFDFPLSDGEYTVTKEGVMKLADGEFFGFQKNKESLSKNKDFLRKVIMLAEDDDNDGWDKLTDMEVAVYCWGQFYQKHQYDNDVLFMEEYKDYLDVTISDMHRCMNEYSMLQKHLHGLYAFDHDKVMAWNKSNGQESVVDEIQSEKADDYWYDVAIKSTFKPSN